MLGEMSLAILFSIADIALFFSKLIDQLNIARIQNSARKFALRTVDNEFK
jgi:hypothetical protein